MPRVSPINTSFIAVLKMARRLISDPNRWTKGELARDDAGKPVPPTSGSAYCWCAQGAIEFVLGPRDLLTPRVSVFTGLMQKHTPRYTTESGLQQPHANLFTFNDLPETTHADILKLFDRAIDGLERQLQ